MLPTDLLLDIASDLVHLHKSKIIHGHFFDCKVLMRGDTEKIEDKTETTETVKFTLVG